MSNESLMDRPLTDDERRRLAALLDTLVPASEDGAMPSARDVGFDGYLVTHGEQIVPLLRGFLAQLDDDFAELSLDARCARVGELSAAEPAGFAGLLAAVYDCYYQDDRVREKIGVVRGPVFPQGNEVAQGDLSLVDPVVENAERFRYRST